MSNNYFAAFIGCIVSIILLTILQQAIGWPFQYPAEKKLNAKVIALSAEVKSLNKIASLRDDQLTRFRRELAICNGTMKGSDSSLEDLYQVLMFAKELRIAATDEDGEFVLLTLNCKNGDNEQ